MDAEYTTQNHTSEMVTTVNDTITSSFNPTANPYRRESYKYEPYSNHKKTDNKVFDKYGYIVMNRGEDHNLRLVNTL